MTKHQRRGSSRLATSWWFPPEEANFSGEMVSELTALIDSNTIRVLDAVMITRADDGSGEATEMRGADDGEIASRARSSGPAIVLAEKDVNEIGASLVRDVGWAVRPAVRRSGAERRESGRIPTQALIASVVADPHAAFERSMKIGPLRDRGDRPRLLGGGHERREEQRDDRGDRREDGRDDRGDRPDDRRDHGAGPGLRRR